MLRAFEFCIPIAGTKVPAGPEWLHEVKYDRYRIRLERDGTRGGYNFADRYPLDGKSGIDRCALVHSPKY